MANESIKTRTIIPFQSYEPFHRDETFEEWWNDDKNPLSLLKKGPPPDEDSGQGDIEGEVKITKDCLKFIMNVHHFKPEELTIKTSDYNRAVVIEAEHQEKSDPLHGYISRHFSRTYNLPENALIGQIQSNLSSDGVLQVVVPLKRIVAVPQETVSIKGDSEKTHQGDAELASSGSTIIEKAKHWLEPIAHALPDFHFEPFWKRFGSYTLPNMFGIHSDENTFKILVDVKHFAPSELSVQTTDHCVTVEGKHGDKTDEHGSLSRHFSVKYDLPASVKADNLKCGLTSYGVLEISAPKSKSINMEAEIEKKLPIVLL
jgi:HSP20 family molecular chaperone IbpA